MIIEAPSPNLSTSALIQKEKNRCFFGQKNNSSHGSWSTGTPTPKISTGVLLQKKEHQCTITEVEHQLFFSKISLVHMSHGTLVCPNLKKSINVSLPNRTLIASAPIAMRNIGSNFQISMRSTSALPSPKYSLIFII